MPAPKWLKSPAVPSIALSVAAAGLLIYHVFCDPTRKFDGWAVALLIIVFLPWLGSIFETIEFPGGGKVEWRKKVEAEQLRQASEIEGLQFLLASFISDDERELLQRLANDERVDLDEYKSVDALNTQLRSLRRLTLIAPKASYLKLLQEISDGGKPRPNPKLNEVFEVTDRGRKYLELSKDLPDVEPLPIGQADGKNS